MRLISCGSRENSAVSALEKKAEAAARKKKEEEGSPVASGDPTDLIYASERFKPSQ
jgi:hypothetical protein